MENLYYLFWPGGLLPRTGPRSWWYHAPELHSLVVSGQLDMGDLGQGRGAWGERTCLTPGSCPSGVKGSDTRSAARSRHWEHDR